MWRPKLAPGKRLTEEIVQALAADIEAGRLAPGQQLPTHRQLAEHLKVAIGTITRAYAKANAQGLITGTTGRGTFVAGRPVAQQRTIDLSRNLVVRDRRDVQVRSLLRMYGDVDRMAALLDEEQDPAGVFEHRIAAARWIRKSGYSPAPEDIVICSGVQHAMHVVLATLTKPGDLIVTEALTYAGIKAIASLLGLQARGLAIDSEGLQPQALEDACRHGAKFLYTTPTLHNPTAATMSDGRRREIARIVEEHGVTVLEDDVYGFLLPDAPPPLVSYAPAHTFHLVGTSKSLAPGIRVGYVVCPSGMQQRIARTVRTTIWETSPLMSGLVTRWLEDGTAERTIAYKQAEVRARHELALRTLSGVNPPGSVTPHWWIYPPEPWRAEDLADECSNRGVSITPAAVFAINRDQIPIAIRICLAATENRQQLQQGLQIVNELLKQVPENQFPTT